MQRFAAFLRAINIGDRRVTNAALVAAVGPVGLISVSAYQAAGNLLIEADEQSAPHLADRLERALEAALGYRSEVFLRNAAEVADLAAAEVFPAEDVAAATAKPQIAFLLSAPGQEAAAAVASASTERDRLVLRGAELWWLPLDGVGRSQLDISGLSRVVGPMTVRTVGTVQRIAAKLRG